MKKGQLGQPLHFLNMYHVQPPMMDDDPPPMTNDDQAPPIGHFEEDLTTTVDAQNPNSMVQAIKEREDRRPGVYDQSPYVREKPVTMPEKEKVVATTVRRMLMEYGAFPDAVKWELHFNSQCPQQASGSLNCAIYVVKYIEALIRR
ncbi:hypothetical protein Taro_011513, partial [Colocasia esculenta]|nr:hypothetical protein [Colocasia esculenta]